MDGSLEESQTAALVASGWLFPRESNSISEVVGSLEKRATTAWVTEVINSSKESWQRFLSTNLTEAGTLRLSSMLNLICRLSLNILRTGRICKAASIRTEEACDI